MNCCICGNEIKNYSNEVYPLCQEDDYTSKCCDRCNQIVVQARLFLMKNKRVETIHDIEQNDMVHILYAKRSDKPITYLKDQLDSNSINFLKGEVTGIDFDSNEVSGTWGEFTINPRTDMLCIEE